MKHARTLWNLVKREIGMISTDRNLTSILLIAPLFYALFYGSIYINKTESNVPITVVDMDHSSTSQKMIRMIDAHQLVSVKEVLGDLNSAKEEVLTNNTQAVLFIPQKFEANLKKGTGTDLKLFLNTTRFLNSNDINKAVNEVIGTIGASVRLKYYEAQGYSFDQSKEMVEPLRLDMRPMFNFTESYGDFLIPAILILILHQTLLIGLSESIAKEREQNSLLNLLHTAGNSELKALLGKSLFYLILYSAYSLLFFGLFFSIFKINMIGDVIALAASTLLMLFSAITMSIFISSFFNRKIFATQFLTLSSYPVFLLSGYSWPMYGMPTELKYLAALIPFTPYSNMMVRITQMGTGWNSIVPSLFHLFILGVVYFLAAYYRINSLINKTATQNT